MESGRQNPPGSPEELIAAAVRKDWTAVDAAIATGIADDPEYLKLAAGKLEHEDANVRDLAVSLYEKTSNNLGDRLKYRLSVRMETDDNRFVRYRAAFALFNHRDRSIDKPLLPDIGRSPTVIRLIREAAADEDAEVSAIAQDYLAELAEEEPDTR